MLDKALADEEELVDTPAEDLLNIEGMSQELAYRLARHGIKTMEDLAELAVDDLLEMGELVDKAHAAQLIMKAREPWFKKDE